MTSSPHDTPDASPEAPPPPAPGLLQRVAALIDGGRFNVPILLGLGLLLWIPGLGSVGLWDPWEPHYAEVARAMLERGDWVHPFWESHYFFSKPVGAMWLMAVGQAVFDVNAPLHGLASSAEWAVRLPFALCAIAGVLFLYLFVSRLVSRRAGFFSGLVLATCPQYLYIGKQAMMDMPLVCCVIIAVTGLAVWLFGPGGAAESELAEEERAEAPNSSRWRLALIYGAYAAMGYGVLTKGLLGLALPGAAFFGFLLVSARWRWLLRMRMVSGAAVFLAVAMPWFLYMSFFPGVDDEGKTFFERFFKHDHLNRLVHGVHTTTPGGTFAYFVEQLGFAMFPWSALLPLALAWGVARIDALRRPLHREAVALILVLCWALIAYTVFTLSITKFHHYIFPAVPALAVIIGSWLAAVTQTPDAEGDSGGTRLFFGRAALAVALVAFVVLAQDLSIKPKHLLDLFVYNYERPYPKQLDPKIFFPSIFTAAGVLMGLGWLFGPRRLFLATLAALALTLAPFHTHVHFNRMGPHWSQGRLFDSYYAHRQPSEPIVAYQMNWRGETWYSRNTVHQMKTVNKLRKFVEPTGREWVLVEQKRYRGMLDSLGAPHKDKAKIVDRSNGKYYLVVIE